MGSGLLEKEFMMTDGRFRSNRVKASSINKLVLACDGHNNGRHKTDIRGRKEGNVLFNDAFSTFYLQLYGAGHMVKDHPDSEKGNPHELLFPINN